jgi:hypothetical protein
MHSSQYDCVSLCRVYYEELVEVEVKLRPTVSRPVRLSIRHPSGTSDQFFFLVDIFFRQLRVCYLVAPSLMSGPLCNLLLPLVPTSAVPLGSEFQGTQYHILLSKFLRLPRPGVPGPRIYISQEQGCPDIPPGTGFPYRCLLRLAGLRWSILSRLHMELKLKLIYDRQSVGQSVMVSGTHLGHVTNFYFSLKFPSDSCVFAIL